MHTKLTSKDMKRDFISIHRNTLLQIWLQIQNGKEKLEFKAIVVKNRANTRYIQTQFVSKVKSILNLCN